MSEIFRRLTAIPSFHEPKPRCDGEILKYINKDNTLKRMPNKVMQELVNKITQVRNDSVDGNYFESSQLFVKSFCYWMIEAFKKDVYVIYLHRNPIEVTMSYYKKKIHQEKQWNSWHLQSHWGKNILKTKGKLSFYENCLWQCYEIRERFLRLYWELPEPNTFEFDFRKLNDVTEWKRLFRQFRIKHKPFSSLPVVSKNEIAGDKLETLEGLLSKWDEPGVWPEDEQDDFDRLDSIIDEGQKIITHNTRRMVANELR